MHIGSEPGSWRVLGIFESSDKDQPELVVPYRCGMRHRKSFSLDLSNQKDAKNLPLLRFMLLDLFLERRVGVKNHEAFMQNTVWEMTYQC
ncbi:Uncharacterised protein [Corynebacterium kutscheri]|uniref:Uncharacterized protein n=1 Tax=Corynebacterium kutscheri TaxID=35755 RepID=A0A0F6R2B9_9CORY|nr:hypothetical protein UL82_06940 [Corynebacterium kutscheri]VEH08832.1 Uncharacterised protein [Corynebacterium kutscheri]VEH09877.1 Uncharacterised protein [Corynebacterium kutscheri]VEH79961.1 Uncharacterised protein [Corynebacterium kutscheri]